MESVFKDVKGLWAIAMPFILIVPVTAHSESQSRDGTAARPRFGTVQEAVNGDAACYLTLKDDYGKPFQAPADFGICSQQPSLIGQRVALTWQMTRIMAGSCEGNPECRQTESVALVTQARISPGKPPARSATAPTGSLCQPAETVVFDCRVGSKRVSVCASADATATKGYLQYRFGRSGAPELILPASKQLPSAMASGGTETYSGGGAAWLRFRQGNTAYVVYTGIGKWGPKGQLRPKAGVAVESTTGRTRTIPCTEAETSLLGQEWFSQTGIVRKTAGETFYIPGN